MMNLPYLVSLHASAVTCTQHVAVVSEELWDNIIAAGKAQTDHLYSHRDWPIDGGSLLCAKGNEIRRELLLTGHEDGTIRFWDAGSVALTPLYKYNTATLYTGKIVFHIKNLSIKNIYNDMFIEENMVFRLVGKILLIVADDL